MKNENIKTSRSTLFILLLVFAVPVVLAKLALSENWFNKASTNKGELIQPPVSFDVAYPQREAKWYLTYISDQPCQKECELALYSLQQIYTALGKDKDRVKAAAFFTETQQIQQAKASDYAQNLTLERIDSEPLNQLFPKDKVDNIFIVDALGNVILRYPLQVEKEAAVMSSRDVLADMRKLLKLSRIG